MLTRYASFVNFIFWFGFYFRPSAWGEVRWRK